MNNIVLTTPPSPVSNTPIPPVVVVVTWSLLDFTLWNKCKPLTCYLTNQLYIRAIFKYQMSLSRFLFSSITEEAFTELWVTRQVCIRKQELLAIHEHLCSPPMYWFGVCCSYVSSQCWHLNGLINGMDIAKWNENIL